MSAICDTTEDQLPVEYLAADGRVVIVLPPTPSFRMNRSMAAKKRAGRTGGDGENGAPRTRIAGEQLPRRSLEKAEKVAQVLRDVYAGKSASFEQLATAFETSANNANFKYTVWSAVAYGLVIRDEETGDYALAEPGRKLVAPMYAGEDREGRVKAILTPAVLSSFYTTYNGNPIPADPHFGNVLEAKFAVPRDRVDEAKAIIIENANYAGVLHERDGQQPMLKLEGVGVEGAVSTSIPITSAAVATPGEADEGAEDWTKICFFITPIGDDGSETRKHADMILKHLVTPVAAEHGLEIVRADKIEKSGLITRQVLEHIARARLCITDLSFNNPNVFYELGIRHMTHLPSVQFIKKGDRIPFDVAQGRTITVDTSDTYTVIDRVESAKRELSEHVKNALARPADQVAEDNPIAVYLPGLKTFFPK